jgi:hypothetical protein
MRKRYKNTTAFEVYELLDKAIATTDEATFKAQLQHLLDKRKEYGFTFNDHKPVMLPARKAWRATMRKVKEIAKNGKVS